MDPSEQLRERILSSARERFMDLGYQRVTMDIIAQDIGISKKTLYKEFATKEELLRTVVISIQDTFAGKIEEVHRDTTLSFLDRITRIMTIVAMQYSKLPPFLLHDLRLYAPELWKEVAERKARRIERCRDMLREGVKQKVFRADIDIDIVSMMFSAIVQNMFQLADPREQEHSIRHTYEEAISVLFYGLLTKESREFETQKVSRKRIKEHSRQKFIQ